MAYRKIGTRWDEGMREDIDIMFKELFDEYIGAGNDASEAKEKAIQAVADALLAKDIAETTRDEMTAIIREQTEGGDLAPEVTQARGNHDVLGDRLNSIDQDLAQTDAKKADRNELQTGLASKIGKGENEQVTMAMLAPDIKQAINEGEWDISVNTSELEDGAVTSVKRTAKGDVGQVIIGTGADLPTLNLTEKHLTLHPTFWIVYKGDREQFSEEMIIPFDGLTTNQTLLFNLGTKTFRFLSGNRISQHSENEIILYSFSVNENWDLVRSASSTFDFKIIGGYKESDILIQENSIKIKFEYGGWSTGGAKTPSSDSYLNLRSTKPYYIFKGEEFSMLENEMLEYEIRVRDRIEYESNHQNDLIYRSGYLPFGTPHETPQEGYHYIVIRRADGEPMTSENLEFVDSAFQNVNVVFTIEGNDFELDNINQTLADVWQSIDEVASSKTSKDVRYSFTGQVENLMTETIPNFFEELPTPQEFHDKTISIINNNSDIASYELLGQDGYGYNLYKYEISPYVMRDSDHWNTQPTDEDGEPLEIPKIIITSGVHGSERNANFVIHYLIKHLLENPDDIEVFDTLAQNIHWVFVPLCNPSGYVDNTYENRSGMNLNRDFPPYGSVTQPETQLIKAVLDEHSDADYHIDYHNFTPQREKLSILGYALTSVSELKRLTTNTYKYVGRQYQLKDERYPQDRKHQWGYTADDNVGTAGRYTHTELGIPSAIVESPKWQLFFEEADHGETVTQLGVDILSNVLINIIKHKM